MRIDLSEDGNSIHPLAFFNAMSFLYFPSCEASRRQAVLIAQDERMRAERDSEAKVSDLTHSTIVAVSKKSAQRQIVGLMTLALVAAKAYGVNQSQEACAEVVSEMVNNMPEGASVEFLLHTKNGVSTLKQRLRGAPENIKDTFRKYRAVAHLCGAEILADPRAPEANPFLPNIDYESRFLATASAFQRELSELYAAKGWWIWDIDGAVPKALREVEHFDLFRSQLDKLFEPYLNI